ncbi:hypothetical protein AB1N83_000794 [Pleurotus pulmonarius]
MKLSRSCTCWIALKPSPPCSVSATARIISLRRLLPREGIIDAYKTDFGEKNLVVYPQQQYNTSTTSWANRSPAMS